MANTALNDMTDKLGPDSKNGHRHVVIDPITRLEGHGKIDIILNQQ